MYTIVLATQKGGSGKSTLAIGLALAAIQAGHTVRLIETDSLGTLSNWQSRRPYAEPLVEPIYNAREIEPRLKALAQSGVTLTIIDTAGGLSSATTAAICCADLCLIPARPERRRHRSGRDHAQPGPVLRQAVRLRAQPDPDPRPTRQ